MALAARPDPQEQDRYSNRKLRGNPADRKVTCHKSAKPQDEAASFFVSIPPPWHVAGSLPVRETRSRRSPGREREYDDLPPGYARITSASRPSHQPRCREHVFLRALSRGHDAYAPCGGASLGSPAPPSSVPEGPGPADARVAALQAHLQPPAHLRQRRSESRAASLAARERLTNRVLQPQILRPSHMQRSYGCSLQPYTGVARSSRGGDCQSHLNSPRETCYFIRNQVASLSLPDRPRLLPQAVFPRAASSSPSPDWPVDAQSADRPGPESGTQARTGPRAPPRHSPTAPREMGMRLGLSHRPLAQCNAAHASKKSGKSAVANWARIPPSPNPTCSPAQPHGLNGANERTSLARLRLGPTTCRCFARGDQVNRVYCVALRDQYIGVTSIAMLA